MNVGDAMKVRDAAELMTSQDDPKIQGHKGIYGAILTPDPIWRIRNEAPKIQ